MLVFLSRIDPPSKTDPCYPFSMAADQRLPLRGWATQEISDTTDRAAAEALLLVVQTHMSTSWDGTHSCVDRHADMPWFFVNVFFRGSLHFSLLRALVKKHGEYLRDLTLRLGGEKDGEITGGISSDVIQLQMEVLKTDHCRPQLLRLQPLLLSGSDCSYCPQFVQELKAMGGTPVRGVGLPSVRELVDAKLMIHSGDHRMLERTCLLVYNMQERLGHLTTELELHKSSGSAASHYYYKLIFNGITEVRYSFLEFLAHELTPEVLLDAGVECEGSLRRELQFNLGSVATLAERRGLSPLVQGPEWPRRRVTETLSKRVADLEETERKREEERRSCLRDTDGAVGGPSLRYGASLRQKTSQLFTHLFSWRSRKQPQDPPPPISYEGLSDLFALDKS